MKDTVGVQFFFLQFNANYFSLDILDNFNLSQRLYNNDAIVHYIASPTLL